MKTNSYISANYTGNTVPAEQDTGGDVGSNEEGVGPEELTGAAAEPRHVEVEQLVAAS